MRRSKAGRGNVEGAAVDVQKQGMVGGRSDGSMPISQRGRVSCVLVSDGSGKGHSQARRRQGPKPAYFR